eukprot:CAMPEP_0172719188 /NCGR_PEP_ID=MMETSP1074-20121228/75361_1 /TAXON_ID=2916 /ORGANISM="Ceratium fusus, Strain PA161109" /LENGTH=355 /DNA_ID=CAMNT_0013544513 /DNA_START=16 /DNA_END=1079 /DNA_ORIENTATION=-
MSLPMAMATAFLSVMSASCSSVSDGNCTNLLQTRAKSQVMLDFDGVTGGAQGCTSCCNNGTALTPCFDAVECAASGPAAGKYAFVFTYTGEPPNNFLPHIERAARQSHGSSTFDLILLMTKEDAKTLNSAQKQRMKDYNVQLKEVDWAVPPNMKYQGPGHGAGWCGSQDFVRLHALGFEGYDAVAYYDTDIEFQGDVTPVLRCAAQGRFLTTNGGTGEPLNVGFFAMKPSSALLQAALAFARDSDYNELTGWGKSYWAPAGGYFIGGECGQGFFHHLFYKQDQEASKSALAEAGFAPGSLVVHQLDRCTWNYQTSYDCPDFDCSRVRAHHKPGHPLTDPHECLKLGQKWEPRPHA